MTQTPAERALAASTVALLVALGCIVMLLPPLVEYTVASVLRVVAVVLALATAVALHWVFLGLGARRMARSAAGWVGLSVLLFPVGSALSLILLGWFCGEAASREPAAHGA